MNDLSQTRLWLMRGGFLLLTLVILFFHLLPLETTPRRWAGPDLLLCFALAWSMRRPEYVPAPALAAAFLLADLLLQRPPGLWALLVLLSCEFLKSRMPPQRETPFLGEWSAVAVIVLSITVINRLVLGLLGVEQAHIALIFVQAIMTLVAYPLVVLVSQSAFGVRRLTPAEIETLGARQ